MVFSNNSSYFSNILNWEDISIFFFSDFFFIVKVVFHVFFSFFWSVNVLSYSSLLDLVFGLLAEPFFFINAFFFDMFLFILAVSGLNCSFIFIDTISSVFLHPEVVFFWQELISYNASLAVLNVSVNYDSFSFNIVFGWIVDYVLFFTWTVFILFLVLALTNLVSISRAIILTGSNFFFLKFILYGNNFAFENRLQLDWVLFFLSFILFTWLPLLMTYDDTNVEVIELLHSFICLFFLFIIFFLLYKYSVHYFSFLENTVSEGYSTSYIFKQFIRDVSNTFALFLRFFLLLFRLNIYDGLDDFLDSYYIFFIDFDEDSYFDEIFVSFDFLFYFSDNREDVIFYKPLEFDWWGDLYSRFFILFGKFFFFWALILEEIFRVSLAFYISYLIIFEVHAVNLSFFEDRAYITKR